MPNDLLTDLGKQSRRGVSPGRGGRGVLRVPTDTPSSRASSCTTSPGTGTSAFLTTPNGDCAIPLSEKPVSAG